MANGREWFVYLLECSDGSYYCGISTDVQKRLEEHNAGTGSKYVRSRLPANVVVTAGPFLHKNALIQEAAVKKLKKDKKIAYLQNLQDRLSEEQLALMDKAGTVGYPFEERTVDPN